MINPGFSFSESLFSVVRTQLCLKYPLCLELDVFPCYCWPGFLPSIFLFLFVLCAHPETSLWAYMSVGVYPHKCAHTQTHVYIYPGKGRVI